MSGTAAEQLDESIESGGSAGIAGRAQGAQAAEDAEAERGRRAALKAGALAVAGLLLPSLAGAQGARRKGPGSDVPRPFGTPATLSLDPIDPTAAWVSPELRLVRRITMGLTDAEGQRARQLGYEGYLDYHLAADQIDDGAVTQYVATTWSYTTQNGDALYNIEQGTLQTQLTNAAIYRSAFSTRQLKERLVEFWTDHFNIDIQKVGYLKVLDDRDVVRQYAMTTFPQLLRASAHSPAMLSYLDQTISRRGSPNQNYAREIMELHTLGVNGGYTQNDVAELSRVLTGWTIAGRGVFTFDPNLHDYGAKTVLGITIPATTQASVGAAAQNEGEGIINVLVAHVSTATFVSQKMLRYFLRYDPTDEQVAQVASVYLTTGGDIKSMLRAVLSRQNVMSAPAKFKRPYHYVVSAVRALAPTVANVSTLAGQISVAGQAPYTYDTPDGYPDSAEYWSGNILPRWNSASFLANANSASSVQFNVTPFMTPATPSAIVGAIDRACFGGEMPQRLRDELVAYVSVNPTSTTRVRETIGLALSSSTFQYF